MFSHQNCYLDELLIEVSLCLYIEDIYFLIVEYQIYFIQCVENIRIPTSAQHK